MLDELADPLRLGFYEYFRKMKKPKEFNTFLHRNFKSNGHLPSNIVNNIKRHETELKWIKFLQSPFL